MQEQGKISYNSVTHESTNTSIHITDIKDSLNEVQYKIWRTADGKESAKSFSSKEKEKQFTLPFDIKEFEGKRGEFQIEATGMKEDGKQSRLRNLLLLSNKRFLFLCITQLMIIMVKALKTYSYHQLTLKHK